MQEREEVSEKRKGREVFDGLQKKKEKNTSFLLTSFLLRRQRRVQRSALRRRQEARRCGVCGRGTGSGGGGSSSRRGFCRPSSCSYSSTGHSGREVMTICFFLVVWGVSNKSGKLFFCMNRLEGSRFERHLHDGPGKEGSKRARQSEKSEQRARRKRLHRQRVGGSLGRRHHHSASGHFIDSVRGLEIACSEASLVSFLPPRHRKHKLGTTRGVGRGGKGRAKGGKGGCEMLHRNRKRARSSQARRPNALRPHSISHRPAPRRRVLPAPAHHEGEQDDKYLPFARQERKRKLTEKGGGAEQGRKRATTTGAISFFCSRSRCRKKMGREAEFSFFLRAGIVSSLSLFASRLS